MDQAINARTAAIRPSGLCGWVESAQAPLRIASITERMARRNCASFSGSVPLAIAAAALVYDFTAPESAPRTLVAGHATPDGMAWSPLRLDVFDAAIE